MGEIVVYYERAGYGRGLVMRGCNMRGFMTSGGNVIT